MDHHAALRLLSPLHKLMMRLYYLTNLVIFVYLFVYCMCIHVYCGMCVTVRGHFEGDNSLFTAWVLGSNYGSPSLVEDLFPR